MYVLLSLIFGLLNPQGQHIFAKNGSFGVPSMFMMRCRLHVFTVYTYVFIHQYHYQKIYIYTHIACSIGLLGLYVLISCPQDSKHHFLDVSRCVVWTMLCWMTCAIWIIVCTFTKVTKDVSPAHVICTGIVSLSPMSHLRVEGQAQQHLLHVSLSLGLQNSGVSCTKSTARKHHFDFILAKNTKDVWKKPQFWLTEKGWKVESIRYCVYIYFKKYAYIYMYNYIYNYIYIYITSLYMYVLNLVFHFLISEALCAGTVGVSWEQVKIVGRLQRNLCELKGPDISWEMNGMMKWSQDGSLGTLGAFQSLAPKGSHVWWHWEWQWLFGKATLPKTMCRFREFGGNASFEIYSSMAHRRAEFFLAASRSCMWSQ